MRLNGLSPFLLIIATSTCAVLGFSTLRHLGLSTRYYCRENIVPLPEPVGWRDWPREKAGAASENQPGTLFGYTFTYDTLELHPMPAGIVNTHLTDPKLCPSSSVTLSGWFSGDRWWTRGPGQLTLHRGPKDGIIVISGSGSLPGESADTFVTAFARRPDGWRGTNQIPGLPFDLAAMFGLMGLGFATWRPKFQRAILWTAWLGVAACVVLKDAIADLVQKGYFSALFP
jgi:hypothetical protein